VRGIQHSNCGKYIFVSIGDTSCLKLNSDTLAVEEDGNIYIIDDETLNDSNRIDKSITLVHKHMNCVVAMEMNGSTCQLRNNGPINLSDL